MTRRLLLSYLTVTLFVLIVLEVPFGIYVAEQQRQELTTSLERDALVLATIYEDALDNDAPYSPQPAADYAAGSSTRVVVTDREGVSIVDTEREPNEDFSNREEVALALEGQIVSGRRRSDTLGRDLLYVAVPVASGGTVYGATRITADPSDVEARINRFWWSLAGIAIVVMAAIALVGWVIARSISRPILAVRDAAVRAGAGDLTVSIDADDAPAELGDLVRRFNEMASRLGDLIERQRAFVGDASHQLRTPLTALRLRLENLEDEVTDGAQGDVQAALVEVERLGRLVEQLLVLARADEAPPPPERVDLASEVKDRCDLWGAVAEERGVTIAGGAGQGPVWAMATPGAVEQILDNLLDNALAVSPPGAPIVMSIVAGTDHHEIHVVDSGPGMAPEERHRAFDRFWRNDSTRSGTGLGLAIVSQLAEASGGTAALRPAATGGVDAVVTLPAFTPRAAAKSN